MQHIQNYAPKISDSFFFSGATSLRAVHIASKVKVAWLLKNIGFSTKIKKNIMTQETKCKMKIPMQLSQSII